MRDRVREKCSQTRGSHWRYFLTNRHWIDIELAISNIASFSIDARWHERRWWLSWFARNPSRCEHKSHLKHRRSFICLTKLRSEHRTLCQVSSRAQYVCWKSQASKLESVVRAWLSREGDDVALNVESFLYNWILIREFSKGDMQNDGSIRAALKHMKEVKVKLEELQGFVKGIALWEQMISGVWWTWLLASRC